MKINDLLLVGNGIKPFNFPNIRKHFFIDRPIVYIFDYINLPRMKKYSKRVLLAVFVFCQAFFSLQAQNQVLVNITVVPPYSPYISTYVDQPNKVLLTMVNQTNAEQRIKLWVRIEGDNGVSGTTKPDFAPANPIILPPFGTYNADFTKDETRGYFDPHHVALTGITQAALIQNQALPEGNYTICVRALDYSTGQPLSMEGTGCTAPFGLYYIDAPQPIQPFCSSVLPFSQPQNLVFSWTPPATAPGAIQYEFTLKEVPNTLNPADVIKNAAFPVLFNTTVMAANVLVYTNAYPLLDAGKKYVWRVKATDPFTTVQFKNAGYSEPCFFTMEAASITDVRPDTTAPSTAPIVLKTPANHATIDIDKTSSTTGVADHYTFEWKRPSPIPGYAFSGYVLRIAELKTGQTPAQAFAVDTQVKSIYVPAGNIAASSLPAITYRYKSIGDFKPGVNYVWDVHGTGNGSASYNKYFSDVWTFQVKKNYGQYTVSGHVNYSYHLPKQSVFSWTGNAIATNVITTGGPSSDKGGSYPYANKKINFYKALLVTEGNSPVVTFDGTAFMMFEKAVNGKATFSDIGEWVGSTNTDALGYFEFKTGAVLGEIKDTTVAGVTYHYKKGLKISVADDGFGITTFTNPYVNDPDNYVMVDEQKNVTKDFYARVKSFNLDVTFKELPKKNYYNKTQPVEQQPKKVIIYVLRKTKYPQTYSPHHECGNENEDVIQIAGKQYAVISRLETSTNIPAHFKDLVVNDDKNPATDKFYVYAKYSAGVEEIMTPVEYRTSDYESCNTFNIDQTYQASSDYEKYFNAGCYDRKITIVPDLLVNTSITGILKGHWNCNLKSNDDPNVKADKPLANTPVMLVAEFVYQNPNGTETIAKNLPASITNTGDWGIFAITSTDGAGQFKFDFNVYSDSSKLSTKLGKVGSFNGKDVYRVLRVNVINDYYYSPDNSFVVDGGYNYDIGTLTANVREARMQGRITKEWTNQDKWVGLNGLRVYLCRGKNKRKSIPADEGNSGTVSYPSLKDQDGVSYDVVAETNTDKDGYFTFTRLAGLDKGKYSIYDDSYFVMVQPDELGMNNYSTPYPVEIGLSKCLSCTPLTYNSQQPADAPEMTNLYIEAKALAPRIRGTLHPASNMAFTALQDAKVMLFSVPDKSAYDGCVNEKPLWEVKDVSDVYALYGVNYFTTYEKYKLVKTFTTGADGKFDFQNLSDNKIWLLWVQKAGFLDQVYLVRKGAPLLKGQQESVFLDLRLPIEVKVKLVEEGTTTGVKSKIIVGQGYSWAQTQTKNCSYNNYGGSTGPYGVGPAVVAENCDEEATLLVPYGKVKLYIYPDNMDLYRVDSVEVTVKSSTQKLNNIEVKRKRHEIDFYVYSSDEEHYISYAAVRLTNANVKNEKLRNAAIGNGPMPFAIKEHVPYLEFESNATKFEFIVYGYDDKRSYVPKVITVTSDVQKDDYTYVEVALDPGATLKGRVMSSGKPVAGAKVYVDQQHTSIPLEAISDADGRYELRGIPMKDNVLIHAVKSPSNYVGDNYTGNFKPTNSSGGSFYYNPTQGVTGGNFNLSNNNWTSNYGLGGLGGGGAAGGTTGGGGMTVGGNVTGNLFGGGNGFYDYNGDLSANTNALQAWQGEAAYQHDFELVESNFDLSTFLGFPVEVTGIKNGTNGAQKVTGRLVNLPSNNVVKVSTDASIPFVDVEVKAGADKGPSGKPLMNPVTLPVWTGCWGIPATLYNKTISGLLTPNFFSGLQLDKSGNKGVVKGMLVLQGNTFTSGVQFNQSQMLLAPAGGPADGVFNAITSDKSLPEYGFKGFNVFSYASGGRAPIKFNLYGRYPNAESHKDSTLLLNDQLYMPITLHTNIQHVDGDGDILLKPGLITLTINDISGIYNSTTPISLKLGQWSLTGTKWSLTKEGGLVLKTGAINTGISVPFTNMSVYHKDLMFGEYQINNLKLGGIVDISVKSGSVVSFGYDNSTYGGCWSMVVLPPQNENVCSTFGPLEGMTGGSQFKISSIRSFSKGSNNKIMLVNDAAPVEIYKVAKFQASALDAGKDYIQLGGCIDFNVPQLIYQTNFGLKYMKDGSGKVVPFFNNPGEFKLKTKGISATFPATDGTYVFKDNLLQLKGELKDQDPAASNYKFDVQLTKTSTDYKLEAIGTANRFYYENGGTRYVTNIKGSMNKSGAGWNNFSFNGDLAGMDEGVKADQKKVYMTIKGDIVADPGNQIGVKNVETPLGNMSFVYDVNKKAVIGTAHIESALGVQQVTMDMELLLGKDQWYVFGSGNIKYPPDFLFKETKGAMWLGYTKSGFSPTILSSFKSFSLDGNSLPANISGSEYIGIINAGSVKMPVPKIPQIDLNLGGFVQAGLDHEIGLNIINSFKYDGLSSSIGFLAGGYVYLHAYAGASVVVGCVHASVEVKEQVEIAGSISKDHISVATTAGTGMCLGGSAEIGGGCCDSDCDGHWYCPCISDGVSAHCWIHFGASYENNIPPSGLGSFDFSINGPSCGTGGCE